MIFLLIRIINNMKRHALFILLGSLLLAGCQSRELHISEVFHLPSGGLFDIVWLDSQTIIMDIDEGNYPKIAMLDINSHESRPIHIESTCKRPYTRSFQILPNQSVGFILDCPEPRSQIIQDIDLEKNTTNDIFVEPYISTVGNFSYSHDMKEIILVDDNGLYTDSSLYHLDASGNRINVTPDFQRADFPAWSPTDDVIAFLGTRPRSESDDTYSWSQIENLLDYPWNLYLYNPKNQKIDELPLEIVRPSRFKWSPNGKLLAFAGEYKGSSGVWIVSNLNTPDKLTLTRVVRGSAVFDFSPDSNSLAFAYGVYSGQQYIRKQNTIYVIDLPAQNINP